MLCLISAESRVQKAHPLRELKRIADEGLRVLGRTFERMYADSGRPSVPPERLLKALVLQALYSIRSERQLCEQLEYNLLFRWFLDMDMTEPAFDASTFSRNRDRLLRHRVAARFFDAIRIQGADLMSHEHFTVDGTMLEAWGSLKSFQPNDADQVDSNGWADFRGSSRSNETHESKTDPESRLWRKGKGREAKLSFMGHALMENRNGLLVGLQVSRASGFAERRIALEQLQANVRSARATVGADRGYDTRDFVAGCRAMNVTPHVSQHQSGRQSSIDGRTVRHIGYRMSQCIRKRIEPIFGWRRYRGVARTQLVVHIAGATYNLLRIANLRRAAA
jgi:transposase